MSGMTGIEGGLPLSGNFESHCKATVTLTVWHYKEYQKGYRPDLHKQNQTPRPEQNFTEMYYRRLDAL